VSELQCAGAHVREGGVGFLERIGFVDRQAKAAGFNRWQQIGAHAAVDLADFFRAAGTEGDADVIDAFHRMQVEIELALHAAEAADIDDTAAHAGRLHVGVRDIAGNLVDDEIDALTAGRFPHCLNPLGTRRVLYTPCSETDVYIALTMLDHDAVAKAVPVRKDDWKRAFPHLGTLIDRIGEQGRYDRFELIKLKSWSAGRVAMIGDSAHALPPNIGQGGGCAMMNALSLAVYLERDADIGSALRTWEAQERPITEHAQRISYILGLPTTWPPALRTATLALAGHSKWLVRQRTRTALHRPTGT
jgi:hypothetical protein